MKQVGQQLGHYVESPVVLRVDLIQLFPLEGTGGVGGEKRRKIFVRRAEQLRVDLPPQIPGKPLHRGGVKLIHETFPPGTYPASPPAPAQTRPRRKPAPPPYPDAAGGPAFPAGSAASRRIPAAERPPAAPCAIPRPVPGADGPGYTGRRQSLPPRAAASAGTGPPLCRYTGSRPGTAAYRRSTCPHLTAPSIPQTDAGRNGVMFQRCPLIR